MIAKVGNKLRWLDTASFDRSWLLSYLEVTPGSCIHLQRTAKERQIILCIIYFSDKHVSIVNDFAQPRCRNNCRQKERIQVYTLNTHTLRHSGTVYSLYYTLLLRCYFKLGKYLVLAYCLYSLSRLSVCFSGQQLLI